jgi:hypothetical protein
VLTTFATSFTKSALFTARLLSFGVVVVQGLVCFAELRRNY